MSGHEAALIMRAIQDPASVEDAFKELDRAFRGRIWAQLRAMRVPEADAHDLTQEVFIRVLRSAHTYDPKKGLVAAWISRVTMNVAYGYFRNRRPDADDIDEVHGALTDGSRSIRAIEARDTLLCALDGLTLADRALVVLHHLKGFTNADIALVLGIRESTVPARLARAKNNLMNVIASQTNRHREERKDHA
jgi:RNA polymerase sigma-70 factor (ECF subfamily)